MKRLMRKKKRQIQLSDIIVKLDELTALVRQLHAHAFDREKPPPSQIVAHAQHEPQFKPSSHARSLSARSEEELMELAFGRVTYADPPLRSYAPHVPRVDKNLGTL